MRLDRKQRKLDELIKELKDKEFKYIPREEREIDWSKYDEAFSRSFATAASVVEALP